MIDQIGPGPAGSTGPAGVVSGLPTDASVQQMVQAGTAAIGTALATANTSIQQGIQQVAGTVNGAIAQAAGSVTSGLGQVQSTVDLAQSTARNSIVSQLGTLALNAGIGGPVTSGVKEGTYQYNVYQYINSPYPAEYHELPNSRSGDPLWCYQGSWGYYLDAAHQAIALSGTRPPASCYMPGGPGGPGPGTPPSSEPCSVYQLWRIYDGNVFRGCGWGCKGDPLPPGASVVSDNIPSWAVLQEELANPSLCNPGGVLPPSGGSMYYAGCGSDGKPVSWSSDEAPPAGVSGQVGPFADQQSALAAVAGGCQPPGTNGQPTNGQPPSTACCDTGPGSSQDKCLYIDLCDWQAFEDHLVNALCRFYDKCICKLSNEVNYVEDDCDGVLTGSWSNWWGGVGASVSRANSMDDVVAMAAGNLPASFDTAPGEQLPT